MTEEHIAATISLADASRGRNRDQSICIVTPDLVGIVRNGGVGTACTELCRAFSKAQYDVTVFFTQVNASSNGGEDLEKAKTEYAKDGVRLYIAEEWAGVSALDAVFPNQPLLRMSKIVHDWLRERRFDLVIFMDWQGNGFYSFSARRAGVAHQQHGAMGIICHGTTLWSDLGNSAEHQSPIHALTYFIERRSIEMADFNVSPSRYMFDWMIKKGYKLSEKNIVIPNIITKRYTTVKNYIPNEVVFFGRLEYRKGIVQFCSAIDIMITRGCFPKEVIFLGKMGFVGSDHAGTYLARRTAKWPFKVTIMSDSNRDDAIRFLTTRSALAVVASTDENLPYTVYECLISGVPVVARNVGGISELFDSASRVSNLFDDNPKSLADIIHKAINGKIGTGNLGFEPKRIRDTWTEFFPGWACRVENFKRKTTDKSSEIYISVCLVHFERPALLKMALASLRKQTNNNFEVILVDDGSTDLETQALLTDLSREFSDRGWRILKTENGYVGRARNLASRVAKGNYLLFMDDDNIANPRMIELLETAACRSGADVITSFAYVFYGADYPDEETKVAETYLPVGGSLAYSLAGNAISDTNALVKRSLFNEIGGFTEDYGIGHEDFEFFLHAYRKGADILVVPEALYWYRRQKTSMITLTPFAANRARSLRPFLQDMQADFVELLVLSHGLAGAGSEPKHENLTEVETELSIANNENPDSVRALNAAATISAFEGNLTMALQLLAVAIKKKNSPLYILKFELLSVLLNGPLNHIQLIIQKASSLAHGDFLDFIRMSTYCARTVSINLTIILSRIWIEVDGNSLDARLSLSGALKNAGKIPESLIELASALNIADKIYRKSRPDVDTAVRSGHFFSGLEHFHRHGRAEGADWPRLYAFQELVKYLPRYTEKELNELNGTIVQMLILAFSAFKN